MEVRLNDLCESLVRLFNECPFKPPNSDWAPAGAKLMQIQIGMFVGAVAVNPDGTSVRAFHAGLSLGTWSLGDEGISESIHKELMSNATAENWSAVPMPVILVSRKV